MSRIKDRNTCNAKHIPNISLVTELEARLQKTCFLEAYFTVTSGKRSECTLPLFNVLIKRSWRGRRILLLGFNIQIHPRIISILLAHHCVIWQVTVGGQFFFFLNRLQLIFFPFHCTEQHNLLFTVHYSLKLCAYLKSKCTSVLCW